MIYQFIIPLTTYLHDIDHSDHDLPYISDIVVDSPPDLAGDETQLRVGHEVLGSEVDAGSGDVFEFVRNLQLQVVLDPLPAGDQRCRRPGFSA